MNEKNILIVRCGEVALKGMNKPYFERMLVEKIRLQIRKHEKSEPIEVKRQEGLIFVRVPKEYVLETITKEIAKVFGVASISPAVEAEPDMEKIGEAAVEYMLNIIETQGIKTFKVDAKRADKRFPITSPEIARIMGAKILIGCKVLKVDVHHPDCMLFIDVRSDRAYIYQQKVAGFGGLPLGTNGKGMILLSGGIDSPVAAFMMAKRGMTIEAVHFHSYPYTSERAQEKVMELAKIIAQYCGAFRLHCLNLLPAQEEIVQKCMEEDTTILVRRFMMRIAEKIALETGCQFLITGENLGQVASQTADALVVTDASVAMAVMRPLIAFDKVDIIDKAKEIGTFEKSIEPYEDCCTVFLPKHPSTKPKLDKIVQWEKELNMDALVQEIMASRKIFEIKP